MKDGRLWTITTRNLGRFDCAFVKMRRARLYATEDCFP
jgi:hypothetical protein